MTSPGMVGLRGAATSLTPDLVVGEVVLVAAEDSGAVKRSG